MTILSASPVWTLHRGAFCQFPFRWIYYCHGSDSTGKETGKIHLCALVHCVLKHSRPPNLKPSSNLSLPFSWIRAPKTDPNFSRVHILLLLNTSTLRISPFFLDEKDTSQETKLVHKSSFSFGPPGLRSMVQQ